MSHLARSVLAVAVVVAAAIVALPGTASAAPTTVGYDVSYPQCDTSLPADRAFAVVGVNGGIATRPNPCLATQLAWAAKSSGAVPTQPRVQLYLNTANPGELLTVITTWPTAGTTPYGTCDGTNSRACSWQYGWDRAQNSVANIFTPAAKAAGVDTSPTRYPWWLDVETGNTWQNGSAEALARNRAALEGMTSYLISRGARVGLYSTSKQWAQITGTMPPGSILAGLPSWLAGATSLKDAKANCAKPALVPSGRVTLTQYVVGNLDRDNSCV
ncbi:MAG: hypothetical protein ABWY29_01370 [Blastococcus sp.]